MSIEISKSINTEYRKKNGVFFTPKSIRQKLIQTEPLISSTDEVLEPSMGSGEFIWDLENYIHVFLLLELNNQNQFTSESNCILRMLEIYILFMLTF